MNGLVLGGGGVKGSYQIGAFLALKKCNIKIDGVVGTSIGAFNGAMIASDKDAELYKFWKNVDIGYLLGLNEKYIKSVNDKNLFKEFIYGLLQTKDILQTKGISLDKIKRALDLMIDEDKLRNSNIDFGLVTVKISKNGIKPLYLFKNDIPNGKMKDYILASCNLPVFKKDKVIGDGIYIDGGFYDNLPVNMLINKGYKKIYVINIQGIGVYKKFEHDNVCIITPSRFLGSTLNVNKKQINENIKLGYYDTLKVLKNYDGYNYIFKTRGKWYYNLMIRKVNKELINKAKKYFKVNDNKELILKSLEYIMLKENLTYYDVYKVKDIINFTKEHTKGKSLIYAFVRCL